jgi:cytochrome c peroxidase
MTVFAVGGILATVSYLSLAQTPPPAEPPSSPPPSLSTVPVPPVAGLNKYVRNRQAAIVLGKALFWDVAAGSDGMACASCHFHAGADSRIKNQLNPGLLAGDQTFNPTASGAAGGPNYTLRLADFPFHQFTDPNNRLSGVFFTTNEVSSSSGTFNGEFITAADVKRKDSGELLEDRCNTGADPVFNVGGIGTRKVEPRNSPTVINAVFNFRNFWDGRANNRFNGVDPFGNRNVNARILVRQNSQVRPVRLSLPNSSLASQAVGPPLSDFEASCAGRTFAAIGRKLLPRRALASQAVDAQDSVLGPYRHASGNGLRLTYDVLVKQAFNPTLWSAIRQPSGFTQTESNFALFFGLAVQLYESTLISDRAPYDAFAQGNTSALSPAAQRGLGVFLDKGKCINCHGGPEFSNAASHLQAENQEGGLVERMLMGNGGVALYDNGFYNIGVTPTADDISLGAFDPFNNPLSFSAQYVSGRFVDPFRVNPCSFEVPFDPSNCTLQPPPAQLASHRLAVNGAFKTPTLRNVELTGPYMHNGSLATLEQVVQFYNRGGNFFRNPELDPDIRPLGLSAGEQADLVAFMKSLTDPRVRNEQAPFDHPALVLLPGHVGDENSVTPSLTRPALAQDVRVTLPAVGASGRPGKGLPPLKPFHELLGP